MHLIEPCCGTAALSMHMLGARRSLMPYQGNKWRYRRELATLVESMTDTPLQRVSLGDSGPWGAVIGVVLHPLKRRLLIKTLRRMERQDPRKIFDRLQGAIPSPKPVTFAAEFLFLQRLSYSGKAVGVDGRWRSPGFNPTSAYGTPATDRFGEIKPMLPSLIRTLESLGREKLLSTLPAHSSMTTARLYLRERLGFCSMPTVVYIDPPYSGVTGYPNGMLPREEVVEIAKMSADSGASVLVSEGEPIRELTEQHGWSATLINRPRSDASLSKGKRPEWVTWRKA